MEPLNTELRLSRRKEDFKYYIALPAPNETQMRSAIKGDDRYVPRRSNSLAIAVTCLLALVFGIALWIGSGAR